MNRILIIDDEEKLRQLLGRIISLEGYEVTEAPNAKTGFAKLEQGDFDVVLCDVKLPDGNGISMVEEIKKRSPNTEVILLTAYGNLPDGIQAMKNGAFDYITKGDDNNRILPLLEKAIEKSSLSKRVQQLEKQVGKKYSFEAIIGTSAPIEAAIHLARKVGATDTTVLLTGETGSGKEVFAQAIHQAGSRSQKPFVAVNCSAFSNDLLESEMFGHTAGAYTGAVKNKKGLFEEAHTGTIFLDEIGEMPLNLQAKFLRVLETGQFIRLGETKTTQVNVRIVAATNRNLQEEIKNGHFREDLYYRLSVFNIHLPPLRERPGDILMLAQHFMAIFSLKTNTKPMKMQEAYTQALKLYHWPGNIRELRNVIERSVILAEGDTLTTDSLPLSIQHPATDPSGKIISVFELATAEKTHIQKVLIHTKGNKTETARLLNIALTTLYRKIEEYGL